MEKLLRKIGYWIRSTFTRGKLEDTMNEEMDFHLQMATKENIDKGMAPDHARRKAMTDFGGLDQNKEACRDLWILEKARSFWRDFRNGFRLLLRFPSQSAISIVSLALALGLFTTFFSVIDKLMFSGMPFQKPEELYYIRWAAGDQGFRPNISLQDFTDFREQQSSFQDIAATRGAYITLNETGDAAYRYRSSMVSGNFMNVLGVKPILGPGFQKGDTYSGGELSMIINDRIWEQQFNRDPSIIGRKVFAGDKYYTIRAIAPDTFRFFTGEVESWKGEIPRRVEGVSRDGGLPASLVFGRLKPGVSVEQAEADLNAIAQSIQERYPKINAGRDRVAIRPLLDYYMGDRMQNLLVLLQVAVSVVLLGACINIAILRASQAANRISEFAARSALGASPRQIVNQILVESLGIGLLSSLIGLSLAMYGIRGAQWWMNNSVFWPSEVTVELNGSALAIGLGLGILASIGASLMPAIKVYGLDIISYLKEGKGAVSSFTTGALVRSFVVAQVAISFAVLLGMFIMLQIFMNIRAKQLPYDPDDFLVGQMLFYPTHYPSVEERTAKIDEIIARMREIPGVKNAAMSFRASPASAYSGEAIIEGIAYQDSSEYPSLSVRVVSQGYLDMLNVRVLQGRGFTDFDTSDSQKVVLINQAMAERFWPGQSPIGKRLKNPENQFADEWITVIGVVQNLPERGIRLLNTDVSCYYLLSRQHFLALWDIILECHGSPEKFEQPMRDALAKVDSTLGMMYIRPLSGDFGSQAFQMNFVTRMFLVFGAISFLLSLIGVYGLFSSYVSQRIREYCIRYALGANARHIWQMIAKQGVQLTTLGLVVGLIGGYGVLMWLMNVFPQYVSGHYLYWLLAVSMVLATVAAAIFFPARRAITVNIANVLRGE